MDKPRFSVRSIRFSTTFCRCHHDNLHLPLSFSPSPPRPHELTFHNFHFTFLPTARSSTTIRRTKLRTQARRAARVAFLTQITRRRRRERIRRTHFAAVPFLFFLLPFFALAIIGSHFLLVTSEMKKKHHGNMQRAQFPLAGHGGGGDRATADPQNFAVCPRPSTNHVNRGLTSVRSIDSAAIGSFVTRVRSR